MKKSSYILWMVTLSLLMGLTLPYLWVILKTIFIPKHCGFWGEEKTYMWFMIGAVAYLCLRLLIRSKSRFLETLSHELTHAAIALLCGRRIHSIHVEDSGSGVVFTSGNNNYSLVPVALAPYCLPLFTYILLAIRCIVDEESLWICDILNGFVTCFHYICFKTQLGNYQTDINQYPLSFSYYYIVTSWVINTCIILVSFNPEIIVKGTWGRGVFSSLLLLVTHWWENLQMYIYWLL